MVPIGRVVLIAEDELFLGEDFKIRNRTLSNSVSSGGVDITADSLLMSERSEISTSTFSNQNGGDITIDVRDAVNLVGDRNEQFIPGVGRINTIYRINCASRCTSQ